MSEGIWMMTSGREREVVDANNCFTLVKLSQGIEVGDVIDLTYSWTTEFGEDDDFIPFIKPAPVEAIICGVKKVKSIPFEQLESVYLSFTDNISDGIIPAKLCNELKRENPSWRNDTIVDLMYLERVHAE